MIKKILLLVGIVYCAGSLFSQETMDKTYWYTSHDTKGYISIQQKNIKIDTIVSTTLKTTVNSLFEDELLNFSVTTLCDTDKMVAPSSFSFDGTIDSNMKLVHFTGSRLKKDKKNVSYWTFEGDYMDEMETDPDFLRFTNAKYNATIRLPERTIPSFNLWAIIPKLQFDRKGTFIFNSLDETKLYVKKNQTVNYLGKTKITIDGKALQVHKFALQGKKILPQYYWVNNDRELVMVLLDNKYRFILSSKENALQNAILADNNK